MLDLHPLNIMNQPACIKLRKVPLVHLQRTGFPESIFPSKPSLIRQGVCPCADSRKPSRPYARMSILTAKQKQGGKRPWR